MTDSPMNADPTMRADNSLAAEPKRVPRAHRPVASGLSVLARGESFVWLSGGMLIVALGMIVALLLFVLYRGLLTFWPLAVAIYPMHDGGMVAGEPQEIESFSYEASQLDSLSETARQLAIQRLGDKPIAQANRVYLRVGNFDLSGKHYEYLNEFEQSSESPFYPSNIWVVERLHSGRFYGFPSRLIEQFDASALPATQTIERATSLLSMLQGYASDDLKVSSELTTEIANRLNSKKDKSTFDYLVTVQQGTPIGDGEYLEVMEQDGSWKPFESNATLPPQANALRLVAVTPESVWSAFQLAKASIAGLQNRLDELQAELADNDSKIKQSRLSLRESELQYKFIFIDRVADLESDWVTLHFAETELKSHQNTLAKLNDLSPLSAVEFADLQKLYERLEDEYRTQITALQRDVDQRYKIFEGLPTECLQAIAAHRDVLLDRTTEQAKINEQIGLIELEMRSSRIEFQATNVDSVQTLAPENAPSQSSATKPLAAATVLGIAKQLLWHEAESKDELSSTSIGPQAWWMTQQSSNGTQNVLVSGDGATAQAATLVNSEIEVAEIVRAYRPNQLTIGDKFGVFASRWVEFLTANPREAGMEGGFFPAIWGTVVMTMIMALMVVPLGVLAALYLREYATSGWIVGILRIAINNLAGVPSVVYGVFGLAFLCYVVGGYIDGGPAKAGFVPWPSPIWFLMLGVIAVVSFAAFFVSFLCSGSPMTMGPWRRFGRSIAGFIWLLTFLGFIMLLAKSPFFHGFYEANLPNPTFGKGGLVWASLTLALLTLPVVIVATEEALSAVPNSLREGSYACGAGKWQTIRRIVLPHARPGIMTGTILAMARGAGEVAPMMLVGALPMAIDLPLDTEFPFFHGSRSFMHLGFQIYALGFQGQNSEAAKPMVFTTTLLLILIVLLLNWIAIILRSRLRRRFQGIHF